jgi:hypothetical protein
LAELTQQYGTSSLRYGITQQMVQKQREKVAIKMAVENLKKKTRILMKLQNNGLLVV